MTGLFPCSPCPADGGNGGTPAFSRLFPRSPLFPAVFAISAVKIRTAELLARFRGWPWRW